MSTPPEPTADFEALLANVFAHPDDDLARLVFADYVEEQGDTDRAELIRLQVERANQRRAEKAQAAASKRRRRRDTRFPTERETELVVRLLRDGLGVAQYRFMMDRGFLTFAVPYKSFGDLRTLPSWVRDCFEQGWVETVGFHGAVGAVNEARSGLLRLAGTIDLSHRSAALKTLSAAAKWLRPGAEGSRVRHVAVHREDRAAWRELLAKPVRKSPRAAR